MSPINIKGQKGGNIPKKLKFHNFIYLLFILIGSVLLISCGNSESDINKSPQEKIDYTNNPIENEAWESARQSDTIEAFEGFLLRFPNAAYNGEKEVEKWVSPKINPRDPFIDPASSFASGGINQSLDDVEAKGQLDGGCALNLADGRNIGGAHQVGEFFVLVPSKETAGNKVKVSRYEGDPLNYILKKRVKRNEELDGDIYLAEGRIVIISENGKLSVSDGSYVYLNSSLPIAKPNVAEGYKFIGRRPWKRE